MTSPTAFGSKATQQGAGEQPPSGLLARMVHEAIALDQIQPAFQPLVDLRSRHVCGFEILARWRHPVYGEMPPGRFIPAVESEGLLTLLTERLLRQAAKEAANWPGELDLAVNISPRQLQEPGLAEMLQRAVEPTGFPLSRLEVEITEQAFSVSLEVARAQAAKLKALGVRLVLDDFGVEHAGLNRLLELPFDKIKIDSSFVRSLDQRPEGRKIVAAMISLGLSLGLATVTEGVEEPAQADMLIRMGCAVTQGWLYGRAVPASEVPELLARTAQLGPYVPEPPTPDLFPVDLSVEQRLTRLESVFHAAPVGLCFMDLSFRYVTVNECFARMYRLPAPFFIGRTVQEILPGPAAQVMAHLERVLASEECVETEITVQHAVHGMGPDLGDDLVYLRTTQPVRDSSGQIIGLSVALVDITERKRLEAAVREREEDSRYAAELSPHIVWTCDASGRPTFVGPKWYLLTGITPPDDLDKSWQAAVHPEDRDAVNMAWSHCRESGELFDREYRIRRADGHWSWIRSRASARRGNRGEIVAWYGVAEDIDERKLIEDSLKRKADRLEGAVKQLELQLHQDELTGLTNRRGFEAVLLAEIAAAKAQSLPLAVIRIDTDHLREYEDANGHLAADHCVRAIADAILDVVRGVPGHRAARYGGEEFAILLPSTIRRPAVQLASRVQSAVRKLGLVYGSRSHEVVRINVGVAVLELRTGASEAMLRSELLEAADLALFEAKSRERRPGRAGDNPRFAPELRPAVVSEHPRATDAKA